MTNDQLKAFIAVVEQGSFRSAAQHIHKTQPTVSAAVAALEEQFSILLFNRDHYRPTLTLEGRVFYDQAKRLIAQVLELENLGRSLATDIPTSLSISMTAMCAFLPALDTIRDFSSRHTQLQLNITTQQLSGVLDRLDEGHADLAIGPQPLNLQSHYECIELTRIAMVTASAPSLVDQPQDLEIPHLIMRDHPQILPLHRSTYLNTIPGGRRWYANDYLMMKALLMAGMGWARIPKHMIEHELESKELQMLSIENFNSSSELSIYLIRNRERPLNALAENLWREIMKRPQRS